MTYISDINGLNNGHLNELLLLLIKGYRWETRAECGFSEDSLHNTVYQNSAKHNLWKFYATWYASEPPEKCE